MFYLVFGSTQEINQQGDQYLFWGANNPVGVFRGDSPDDACKAAAKRTRRMGTYAAIECNVWGLDLLDSGAVELGSEASEREAKLAEKEAMVDALDARLAKYDKQIAQINELANDND